nr:nuclear transport factor 2 family protein [uncultured Allomuricauda sp.]
MSVYFLFLFAANIICAQVSQDSLSKMALDYMSAYSEWNVEKMGAFYKDSVHFKDPTAVEAFQTNFDLVGKDKVMSLLKSVFPDAPPEYASFKVKEHFVSGTHAIINSNFELVLPKSWFGDSALGKIFVSVPMVTILKFDEKKISSHFDYVDYNSYQKQISFQVKEKKE